jgi:hypothetical protein
MNEPKSEYTKCVTNSEKVAWKLDDILTEGQSLDFSRPFLPESLVQVESIGCLNSAEKRILNHIATNAYLNLFVVAEDFVLAMAIDRARTVKSEDGDYDRIRALTRFADEEIKHQQLFQRFGRALAREFKHECGLLGPPAELSKFVLSKNQVAVLLLTLQLELSSQLHYTEAIRDNTELDPLFTSLYKHHWMEEAQHAAIDALEIEKAGAQASPQELEAIFKDYFELTGAFTGLLAQQGAMNAEALVRATGRALTDSEQQTVAAAQHRSYSVMFMSGGMLHKKFLSVCSQLSADAPARVREWTRANLPEGPSLPI